MHRVQMAVLPGALLGSLVVGWVGMSAVGWNPGQARADRSGLQDQPLQTVSESIAEQAEDPVKAVEPLEDAPCRVSDRYPDSVRQWCRLITWAADEHDLEPDLVAAVMLQESGGDPEALSVSGAVGLLQIMPRDGIAATFQCINGPCFSGRPATDELKDPDFNLMYGARMLAGLFDRLGDWREALKAYGPMDVGYHYADTVLQIYSTYREGPG